jgi:hypothetical protein
MIARFVYVISDATQFPNVQAIARSQHAHLKNPRYYDATDPNTLGWYGDGRDHFEHFDERVPGASRASKAQLTQTPAHDLPMPRLVSNESGVFPQPMIDAAGGLVIGDKRWDVSPASYDRLVAIVREVELALRAEARAVLMKQVWEPSESPEDST